MTALHTKKLLRNTGSNLAAAGRASRLVASLPYRVDADTRGILAILGRTLFLLALATTGVLTITGQPPLFLLPLALFLFFGTFLDWKQPRPAAARAKR